MYVKAKVPAGIYSLLFTSYWKHGKQFILKSAQGLLTQQCKSLGNFNYPADFVGSKYICCNLICFIHQRFHLTWD